MKYEGLKISVFLLFITIIGIYAHFSITEYIKVQSTDLYEIKNDTLCYYTDFFYINYPGTYVKFKDTTGRSYYIKGDFTIKKIK